MSANPNNLFLKGMGRSILQSFKNFGFVTNTQPTISLELPLFWINHFFDLGLKITELQAASFYINNVKYTLPFNLLLNTPQFGELKHYPSSRELLAHYILDLLKAPDAIELFTSRSNFDLATELFFVSFSSLQPICGPSPRSDSPAYNKHSHALTIEHKG